MINGADFVKTSTGKTQLGATLEAAEILLNVIKDFNHKTQKWIGLKISGGITSVETALTYCRLVENIMGKDFLTPHYFRIGASSLLQEIVSCELKSQN